MEPLGYILPFAKTYIQLTTKEDEILSQFLRNKLTSAYMVHKSQYAESKIAYKNIREKVFHLRKHKLIKYVKTSEKHKAIYYTLSTTGILSLLYNTKFQIQFRDVMDNYGNEEIFKICLHPYFQRDTIQSIQSNLIRTNILHYVKDCIDIMYNTALGIGGYGNMNYNMSTVFLWNKIPTSQTGNREFIEYLKERFGFNWLKTDATLKKNIKAREITIVSNKRKLRFKLNQYNSRVTLFDEKDMVSQFLVEKHGEDLVIFDIEWLNDEEYLEQNSPLVERLLLKEAQKLSFDIISICADRDKVSKKYGVEKWLKKKRAQELEDDIGVLLKDQKFQKLYNSLYDKLQIIKNRIGHTHSYP